MAYEIDIQRRPPLNDLKVKCEAYRTNDGMLKMLEPNTVSETQKTNHDIFSVSLRTVDSYTAIELED